MPESEAGSCQVQEAPIGDLTALLNHRQLRRAECLSAVSYLDQDQTLETGDLTTEDDILALVDNEAHNDIDSESDDEPEPIHNSPPPTTQQAIEAVQVLYCNYTMTAKEVKKGIWALAGIDKIVQQLAAQSQVQSTLLNFFRRQ